MAVAAPFAGALVDLLFNRPSLFPMGDAALLELGVREAAAGDQLLGPYSRFGWFHPGPAYFYALVPAWGATGGETWGLYAGAAVINGASALCIVALAHRYGGSLLALTAGVLVLLHVASLEPFDHLDIWNPRIILLPLLVLCVLAASAPRSAPATVGVLALGSGLVQTHIGMAPVVAALTALALAPRLGRPRRWPPRPQTGGRVLAAFLVIVVIWAPPLIQELGSDPGNLSAIRDFVTATGPGPTAGEAVEAVGVELSRFPLGPLGGGPAAWFVLAGYLVLAAAIAVLARRRGNRLAQDLGLVGLVGILAAVVATANVTGTLETYLVLWVSALPVVVWLATAQLLLAAEQPHRLPRSPAVWSPGSALSSALPPIAVIALLAIAVVQSRALVAFPERHWSADPVRQAGLLATRALGPPDRPVAVEATVPPQFAPASGVMLQLIEQGYDVRVDRRMHFLFDARFHVDGGEAIRLVLAEPERSHLDGFTGVGTTEATSLHVRSDPAGPRAPLSGGGPGRP